MKSTSSAFGLLSGVATLSCSLPYIVGLILVVVFGLEIGTSSILLIPAIGTKILGEWIFWSQMFSKEMDSIGHLNNWRSSVKSVLLSQPFAIKSFMDIVMDTCVDIFLIYTALKMSIFPAWIFLVFLGCQAIAAPLYGLFVNPSNKKGIRLFSMIITAVATMAALELSRSMMHGSYIHLFGLSYFPNHIIMLVVIGTKSLLTGTAVIAKAGIAEVIKAESIKNFNDWQA